MTEHHEHHREQHQEHHAPRRKIHHRPAFWLAVILMLAAMWMYLASMFESFQPDQPKPQAQVPAAP